MRRNSKGFSLVELLTVIGILGLLAAIFFPVLSHASKSAFLTRDRENLKSFYLAWEIYANDNNGLQAFGTKHLVEQQKLPPSIVESKLDPMDVGALHAMYIDHLGQEHGQSHIPLYRASFISITDKQAFNPMVTDDADPVVHSSKNIAIAISPAGWFDEDGNPDHVIELTQGPYLRVTRDGAVLTRDVQTDINKDIEWHKTATGGRACSGDFRLYMDPDPNEFRKWCDDMLSRK